MTLEQSNSLKQNRREGKFLFTSVILFFLLCLTALAVWGPTLISINFWWAWLNPKISKIAGGSKLECKIVRWCGPSKICAKYCENKERSVIIEDFYISPLTGTIWMNEWFLASLPKDLSESKEFPRIPYPITSVILEKGDLSLLSEYIPPVDYIRLNRASLIGSEWQANGYAAGKQILVNGFVGDWSRLEFQFHNYVLKTKKLSSVINGNIRLENALYKRKPVKFTLSNVFLEYTVWKGFSLPEAKLNGSIKLNENLQKVIELKSISIRSGPLFVHSQKMPLSVLRPTDKILLEPIEAKLLNPYLKYFPAFKKFFVKQLNGSLYAEVEPNLNNIKNSKLLLSFKNLETLISNGAHDLSLGPLNGKLQFLSQTLQEAELQGKTKIASLQDFLNYPDLVIQSGTADLNLSYKKRQAIGQIKLSEVNALFRPLNLSVTSGAGTFDLQGNKLNGLFKAVMKDSQDPLNAKLEVQFFPQLKTKLQLLLPRLKVKDLRLKETALSGNVRDVNLQLQFLQQELVAVLGNIALNGVNLQHKLLGASAVNIAEGRIDLLPFNLFQLKEIVVSYGSEGRFGLNGTLRLKNLSSANVIANDLKFTGDGKATLLFELLEQLDPKNKLAQQIVNPIGNLNFEGRILNNRLKSLKANLNDFGASYQGQKISKGNGVLELLENEKLSFQDLSFVYGKASQLALDGNVTLPTDIKQLSSKAALFDSLATFSGALKGELYPSDMLGNAIFQKYGVQISQSTRFPFKLNVLPSEQGHLNFDFESHFDSIGSVNSEWIVSPEDNNFPGYITLRGSFNPRTEYFDLSRFDCAINGLNLTAEANGRLTDFSFKAYTDPLINLSKLFKSLAGMPLKGSLVGWIEGKNVNVYDRETFWRNLKMSLKTNEGETATFGPAELTSLETYFESRNGKGFATLVVERGEYKNLPFSEVNTSLTLEGNELKIPGFSIQAAGGEIGLKGELNLASNMGRISGQAKGINVGQIVRGLTNQRGFSGRGDLTFSMNGHLASLIKSEKPVSAFGSFNLRNGNASQVLTLQRKLNLANLVFGGPLALNMNSIFELLDPADNGYYKALYGDWQLEGNHIVLPQVSYRGVNELNLNLAGLLNRSNNQVNINVIGSIPRTPVRVTSNGQTSDLLNVFSQININNILGQLPIFNTIFDARPRVFKFTMLGNVNNQQELNNSAGRTFTFLDSALYSNLPMPKLPEKR